MSGVVIEPAGLVSYSQHALQPVSSGNPPASASLLREARLVLGPNAGTHCSGVGPVGEHEDVRHCFSLLASGCPRLNPPRRASGAAPSPPRPSRAVCRRPSGTVSTSYRSWAGGLCFRAEQAAARAGCVARSLRTTRRWGRPGRYGPPRCACHPAPPMPGNRGGSARTRLKTTGICIAPVVACMNSRSAARG